MSDISAAAVGSLRSRTGVSILECKKALEDADGDEEKAIEILRKRGGDAVAKKADRDQGEGLIFIAVNDGKGAAIFLRCETDFVARDDNFSTAGAELAQVLLDGGQSALDACGWS